MTVTVSMPQLGESVTEGTVTRWLKKEGERVEADEPLLEVSTDKVDTEIPSPASGILRGITVAEDETVAVGAQLAIIDDAEGAGAATDGQAQAAGAATVVSAAPQAPPGGPEPGGYPYAVPEPAPAPPEYAQPAPPEYAQPAPPEYAQPATAYQAPAEPQYRPAVPEYSAPYSQAAESGYPAPATAGYAAPRPRAMCSRRRTRRPRRRPCLTSRPHRQPRPPRRRPAGGQCRARPGHPAGARAGLHGTRRARGGRRTGREQRPAGHGRGPVRHTAGAQARRRARGGPGHGGRHRRRRADPQAGRAGSRPGRLRGQRSGRRARPRPLPAAQPGGAGRPSHRRPRRQAAPARTIDPSTLRGTTERMSRARQLIARRMVESLQTSAQLTTVVEADVTAIARLRDRAKADFEAREGVKLSFLPFFALATLEALKVHPKLNAVLNTEAGQIIYHDAEHLGIAVDTERGLMVPVIRNAGDLNIGGLARKIADLAARTRAGQVSPDDLAGGTFTLTNTGSRGALFDTPIINQPQVAILGTGHGRQAPRGRGGPGRWAR